MHQTYNLPIIGSPAVLEAWNKIDPPSADEIARSKQIHELQGNANPLLSVSNVASHSSMNDNAINVN
jgi:deoxyribonuclease-1